MTKLTDTTCRTAKPRNNDYKLADGNGLYLLVTSRRTKLWRWKYRFNGIERKLSLGAYPEVSLKQAREVVIPAHQSCDVQVSSQPPRKPYSTLGRRPAKRSISSRWNSVRQPFLRVTVAPVPRMGPGSVVKWG